MSEQPKNYGGRPRKTPEEGPRPTVTFRCRPALQEALRLVAGAAGRSVSEEIEMRLVRTFSEPELLAEIETAVERAFARRDEVPEPLGSPPPAYAQ